MLYTHSTDTSACAGQCASGVVEEGHIHKFGCPIIPNEEVTELINSCDAPVRYASRALY